MASPSRRSIYLGAPDSDPPLLAPLGAEVQQPLQAAE